MDRSGTTRRWSRPELLLVMNLYCRIPFGRQHSRAPEVVELARVLDRTPASVAMKLGNLTALDPEEKNRGVKGLSGASRLDREVWGEFSSDWEGVSAESERLWQKEVARQDLYRDVSVEPDGSPSAVSETTHSEGFFFGPTEGTSVSTVRLAQRFFRRTVLTAYHQRCCVSDNPVPELLIASHILPWAEFPEQRSNPANGLCLSRIHDAAFDRGLLTFDRDFRVVLSKRLRDYLPHESVRANFFVFEGNSLRFPEKFCPDPTFLEHHWKHIFQG